MLFPGEKKPLSKLLKQELPLKLDIEHELVGRPGHGKPSVKRKVRIPYEAFTRDADDCPPSERRSATKLLKNYLCENEKALDLPKNWQNDSFGLAYLTFMMCSVRSFKDAEQV